MFQEIIHRTPVCLDLFCFKVPCYHFILFNGIFSLLLIVVTHCYYFKVCKESSKCFEYRNWSRLRINKFASLEYCFVVCQDAVLTTLTLEQQDGCQGERNDELQPGGVHEEETGVSRHVKKPHVGETRISRHVRKPHVGETGVSRHVREPHIGETRVNLQIRKPRVWEIGDSQHIEEPDRISAELPSEQRKQLDVKMITSGIENFNGIVEADRIGHGLTFSRKGISNRACQRMQSGVCMRRPAYRSIVVETDNVQCQVMHGGCYDMKSQEWAQIGETGVAGYTDEPTIPNCDGKEDWAVWINRFEVIAEIRRWDENRKLDYLLPRLLGKVGEYAFTVLPKQVLDSYTDLVNELNSVFRKVEIPRTFAKQFHSRVQGEDESVQEYAIDLRYLYYKAYKHRDKRTREEDLVRRFLDGLRDDEMRFAVEYYKEPTSLDEAVYHAVEFAEIRSRVYRDTFLDKTFSKHGREGNFETYEDNVDRNYREGYSKENVAVQKLTDQTTNGLDMLGQQSQADVFEMLLQLKESLQTLVYQKGAKQLEEGCMKPRQTDICVCYGCNSQGHIIKNCPDRRKDSYRKSEERKSCKIRRGSGIVQSTEVGGCSDTKVSQQDEFSPDVGRESTSPQILSVVEDSTENRTGRIIPANGRKTCNSQSGETSGDAGCTEHDRKQQMGLCHKEYKNQVTPKETAESAGENMAFEETENSSHKELGQPCILWTQQCANTHKQEVRGEEACVSKKEVWINEKMTLGS